MVDVGEDDRTPLGGDAPGKAAADRDAYALLDLLLDPHRRARDELVAFGIEQKGGARVDAEDVARADEQRLQQLLQLEVLQRDVGHRLNALEPVPHLPLRLEQARVLDCNARALRDEAQELGVEVARFARCDEQLSGRAVAELEFRDVRHRCVVLRSVRDAPVVVRGVHGDRARVDAEDLGDAGDELLEERVQLERRERGVRDRLQLPDSSAFAAPDRHAALIAELGEFRSSRPMAPLWP